MAKAYVVPACHPGQEADPPVSEYGVLGLVEKGLDPSTPVNISVDDDAEAIFWVGYYSNRSDWPPPDERMICTWTQGTYPSRDEIPREGYFPNGVGLLQLEYARGFGPPIPALVAFSSAFFLAACGRGQAELAQAALAAGADPNARYISAPEEWVVKRASFLQDLKT